MMSRVFSIVPLSPDQIAIVFPLVNAAYPASELEGWQGFARALIEAPPDRAGVLGLRREGGYFCGLLVYRAGRNPQNEPHLTVDLFVALDIAERRAAVNALIEAAEAKAIALGCAAIQIHIDSRHSSLARLVRRVGYATAAEIFSKKIEHDASKAMH